MPCNRLPRCPPHPSLPYPSRPSSRLGSRPSSPRAVQNQPSQSRLQTLPPLYPTVPAETIYTPPDIQINDQTLSHSAPQQLLAVPGVAVPGTTSSTLYDNFFNLQSSSLSPCPSFSSPLSPSHQNIFPAFDLSLFGYPPVTNAVAQLSPNTHQNPPIYPLFENSQYPLLDDNYYNADHRPSLVPNTSYSPGAAQLHADDFLSLQSSFVHPAPPGPVNHDYSRSVERLPSYHVYHTAPQRPQPEQVLQTRSDPEQQSIMLQQPSQLPDHRLQRQAIPGQGMFYQASNFSLPGAVFIDAPDLTLNMSDNNFMSSFLKETIIGAEFDSSDPNMPLRCHRGTRLKIIKRCQDFALSCHDSQKLLWMVGKAGVGKSAIMQSVARESSESSNVAVGATIFFSINGRHDGTKAVNTIAYQLAVKFAPYRLFVQREHARDPSLLRKSLTTQFNKFIVEPFICHPFLPPSSRLLVILDGLDECSNIPTQRELLSLISFFCIAYPSSPIVWFVASRPEPHITSFFSQPKVASSYEKEEIRVDSEEAYEDVKRFLRDKFREIQLSSDALQHLPQWPSDDALFKITNASGGLFAYASTVVRYISNPDCGDPAGQLDDVLKLIDGTTNSNLSGEDHPMAQLDALYKYIMSKIPSKTMANTRKLLLVHIGHPDVEYLDQQPFRCICILLGMTETAAYAATHHIHAVAIVPKREDAATEPLDFFHKSFYDYLRDFERSGFSPDIDSEVRQLWHQLALDIIRKAPDGVHSDRGSHGDFNMAWCGNTFKNRPGTQNNISLSWPDAGKDHEYKIRFNMFDVAVRLLQDGLRRKAQAFQNPLCMHVLTTCFNMVSDSFPINVMQDFPFVRCAEFYPGYVTELLCKQEPWRSELLDHGILKQVPLGTINFDAIRDHSYIRLRVKGSIAKAWNRSCMHRRKGHSRDWSTIFRLRGIFPDDSDCDYCFQRFKDHFEMLSSDYLVTVLQFTLGIRVVEFRFVDPEDSVSEWIYSFHTGDFKYKSYKLSDGEYQSDDDTQP